MALAKLVVPILSGMLLPPEAPPITPSQPNSVDGSACIRPCDGTPLICNYYFNIENVYSMSKACFGCPTVYEDCFRQDCIIAAGEQITLTVINRQLPGPSIQVCRGDTVRVVVKNNLLNGASTLIHWHGLLMKDTPYMDGVPFVTQCPIVSGRYFTYQFKMNQSGTYMYHGHHSIQRGEGLYGTLIARDPKDQNPHAALYDFDKPEHVLIMMDMADENRLEMFEAAKMTATGKIYSTSLLINSFAYKKINDTILPLANFEVEQGYRYRFRFIGLDFADCFFEVSIDNHLFTVISADANDIKPIKDVNSFLLQTGERFDIIINANQPVDTYWIRMKSYGFCLGQQVFGLATLRYKGSTKKYPDGPFPDYSTALNVSGIMINHLDPPNEDITVIHSNEFQSISPMPKYICSAKSVKKFYLQFGVNRVDSPDFNRPGYYGTGQVSGSLLKRVPQINNISYKRPGSSVLLSGKNLDKEYFCNVDTVQDKNCSANYCECTHLIEADSGDIVELILLSTSAGSHPIHLHGYTFYVLGRESLNFTFTRNDIIQMDNEGKLKRNFINPPLKDTVGTAPNGYVIVRLVADNLGYWFLHCHLAYHVLEGMVMILKVGNQEEMKPMPTNFPTCENY